MLIIILYRIETFGISFKLVDKEEVASSIESKCVKSILSHEAAGYLTFEEKDVTFKDLREKRKEFLF